MSGLCHAVGSEGHRCGGASRWVTIFYSEDGNYAPSRKSSAAADEYRYCRNATRRARLDGAVIVRGRHGFEGRAS